MKNGIKIAVVLLFTVTVSFAQKNLGNELSGSLQGNNILSSEAFIRQLGGATPGNGTGSEISIFQKGDFNKLNFDIKGKGNNITGRQNGDDNTLRLAAKTSNSNFWLEQSGNYNKLDLGNVAGNNIRFQVFQSQNNNSLSLDGLNSTLPAMKIEQSGGMQIGIQSNVFSVK